MAWRVWGTDYAIGSSWLASLRNARFAPDAPFHHRYGHQWFSVEGNPPAQDRIVAVREAFDSVITDVAQREGFGNAHDRIALVGLSQGAIVALDAVAKCRWQIGLSSDSPAFFRRNRFRQQAGTRPFFSSTVRTIGQSRRSLPGSPSSERPASGRAGRRAGNRSHDFHRRRAEGVIFHEEVAA